MNSRCRWTLAALAGMLGVPGAMAQQGAPRAERRLLADDRFSEGRSSVRGRIRKIDRDEREMRIEGSDGQFRVKWENDTDWVRDTKNSSSTDFFVGDEVRVFGRRTERNEIRARRIVWGGQPGWRDGAVGEIVSLDRRAREMEVDFDGEVWTVRFRRADLKKGDDRKEADDLRRGQYVRVRGDRESRRRVDATVIHIVRENDRND